LKKLEIAVAGFAWVWLGRYIGRAFPGETLDFASLAKKVSDALRRGSEIATVLASGGCPACRPRLNPGLPVFQANAFLSMLYQEALAMARQIGN
jgi:hypothetical protein